VAAGGKGGGDVQERWSGAGASGVSLIAGGEYARKALPPVGEAMACMPTDSANGRNPNAAIVDSGCPCKAAPLQ
jgi:hypothetical protein